MIGYIFYNQQIKKSLTSTCRVSKRKEVNSLIWEQNAHNKYYLLCAFCAQLHLTVHVYVQRSQEVNETLKWCISYMYLTLCYYKQRPPANLERNWFIAYCCCKSLPRSYYHNGKNPHVGTAVHHNMTCAIFIHVLAIPYSL